MLSISKDASLNYLSRVIRIENVRKHPNADRLQIVTVDGANIIVGLDVKVGDIMIYCPTESQIDEGFVYINSLFEEKTRNIDNTKKGYIGKMCRVRAVRLRGEVSRALLLPLEYFQNWLDLSTSDIEKIKSCEGEEFDTINGKRFSKKYTVADKNVQSNRNKAKKVNNKVSEHFRFHIDTPHLARNIGRFDGEDAYIQITHKLHGTSGIAAYLKKHKDISWWKRAVYSFLGITPLEYDYIASSRKVIREDEKGNGFYGEKDVWVWALEQLKPFLWKGMSLYFEIVGYVPDGSKMIQKGYDYGCKEGEAKIYIYRITSTGEDGNVLEWTSQQVSAWCEDMGLNAVPEFYYGRIKDFTQGADIYTKIKNWRYMEGNDPLCENSVPFEGFVVRIETNKDIEVYKVKSEAFYTHETKMLDDEYFGVEN